MTQENAESSRWLKYMDQSRRRMVSSGRIWAWEGEDREAKDERKGLNDKYWVELEGKEEQERLMAGLRSRLMFCHGPRQIWLSAVDDERPCLVLTHYKHNLSLHHLAYHVDVMKTDTQDLLQWLLLRVAGIMMAVMRRDTKSSSSV